MGKSATKYLGGDGWEIIEEGFHPEQNRVSESIFSVGNEYMGVRGYFDEGYTGDQLQGSYLNGVWSETDITHAVSYKGLAKYWTFMVNSVDWLYTRIKLDTELLDLNKVNFSAFKRTLNLKTGIYIREFIWQTQNGKNLKISFSRFTSMETPYLGFQQILFEPLNFSGQIEVESGLNFDTLHESIENKNYWNECSAGEHNEWLSLSAATERSNIYVYSAFKIGCNTAYECRDVVQEKKILKDVKIHLTKGEETVFSKKVINYTNKKVNGCVSGTESEGRLLAGAMSTETWTTAKQKHVNHWEEMWSRNDIIINGDTDNQQGIRFCIFQLYQTNHGQDASNNVGAKGLTGEIYSGHTFWDTEAYCLPYYLFTNPDAAKNLLLYRYKTLEEAKKWSTEQNCEGACYPMETIDGRESCPVWWHGNLEIHVPGAVGYGIMHYNNITKDNAFLYSEGVEMLVEITRFYASRGNWREDGFGFYGVMGPDEFHTFVNNNYYTNLLAKKIIEFTLQVVEEMPSANRKKSMPDNTEMTIWKSMADKMILLQACDTGIFEQHEGFFKLPHIDIHAIPKEDFPLYHSWALPRIYRYDMIKQPDVLLALLLFSQAYSINEKRANYEFYEPKCIHESSLSPSVHSILAAELGKKKDAFRFFEFATRLDLDNYNRNTREGLHITSIAAAWLNIVYGFAGMRSDTEILSFAPTIPQQWKSYAFSIKYCGAWLSIEVLPDKAIFYLSETGNSVQIRLNNQIHLITEVPVVVDLNEKYQ